MPYALIADNDPSVNALITELVRACGYDVDSVHDGMEALQRIIADERIRLLVCDMDMPGLEGIDVLRGISEQIGDRAPAAIVVSGFLDGTVLQEVNRFPFVVRSFHKPFEIDEFQAVVGELARQAGDEHSDLPGQDRARVEEASDGDCRPGAAAGETLWTESSAD